MVEECIEGGRGQWDRIEVAGCCWFCCGVGVGIVVVVVVVVVVGIVVGVVIVVKDSHWHRCIPLRDWAGLDIAIFLHIIDHQTFRGKITALLLIAIAPKVIIILTRVV